MSLISKNAIIGNNVNICQTSTIYDNVVIGDNTNIGSYCVLGIGSNNQDNSELIIGDNSNIRSHCVLYSGSKFGKNLSTGHHVLIREKTIVGESFRIGSYSELEGNSLIGNYVNIHSKVMISKKTKIGNFVWIFPRVQTSTDPLPPSDIENPIIIDDLAVVAINSLILPGVKIGFSSYVWANSVVKSNVLDGYCVSGNPAKVFAPINRLIDFKNKIRHPWLLHNTTADYPVESKNLLIKLTKKLNTIIHAK